MTKLTTEEARKKFDELRHRDGRVDPRELDEVWAALDTVRAEDILGEWRGSEFDATQLQYRSRWPMDTFSADIVDVRYLASDLTGPSVLCGWQITSVCKSRPGAGSPPAGADCARQ